MRKKYFLDDLGELQIKIKSPSIVFIYGGLGAGKTTLSRHILQDILKINKDITSPTYNYYNKYGNHYHFDLYRIGKYEEFFNIGGEEILENNTGVILVEWPERIEKFWTPDIKIHIKKTVHKDERILEIEYL